FLSLCATAGAEEPSPSPAPARLDGKILARDDDHPLSAVVIEIGERRAVSDGEGRFWFVLPPGRHHLRLTGAGATAEVDELLLPGEQRSLTYRLQAPRRFETIVRARLRRDVVSTSVRTEEARTVAGTGGDALKVVQSLPGVARASFGGGQLI